MEEAVKIKSVKEITHNVKQFRCEKPENYKFTPGQATEVSVDKEGWRREGRPFTFTSLNREKDLEFVIKIYPEHKGVTQQLNQLQAGDHLIVRDIWGAIEYKGPGTFIAGGAGITPFIAILRDLHQQGEIDENTLLFSNKTPEDIILKEELDEMLEGKVHYLITEDDQTKLHKGKLDRDFLKSNLTSLDQYFYVCGPPAMVEDTFQNLAEMGVEEEKIVIEE